MSRPRRVQLLAAALLLVGCGAPTGASSLDPLAATAAATERLHAVEAAVARWRAAGDLEHARAAAEEARNLVVGPAGPSYGDADSDGTVGGSASIGLLPGLQGEPGLATPELGACAVRDVLGGDWTDAPGRWATLAQAIADWSRNNNTFPSLPSHPQRIVGWATLTLQTSDLATALEFGGHAQLHADISLAAVTACSG